MSFIKKQGAGTWISIITVIVGIVALIIYGAATGAGMGLEIASGSQPFYEASRPEDSAMLSTVVTCGVIALVCLAVGIVLGQFKSDSIVGKVCAILSGALLLRHSLGLEKEAAALERAVERVLDEGYRTADILSPGMKKVGCTQMGDLVAARI